MDRTNARAGHGFSMIEALVSMGIFMVVLTAALTFYQQGHRLYAKGERAADIQENARVAMADMSRQIRMAGYFPENFGATPPSPLLANPIRIGTNDTLAIYGDFDGSGASQVVVFCRDSSNALRRVQGAPATASTYTCSTGVTLAENVTALRFTYYEGDGDPLPDPPTTPYQLDNQSAGAVPNMTTTTQRDGTRRVVVTLTARRQLPGNKWRDYPLTSNVWLRNAD